VSAARRVALVTGGGSGIGAAVARLLASRGTAVALVGRRAGPLEQVAAGIRDAGGTGVALAADVGEPGAPGRIVARVVEALGGLDVLVNNAGLTAITPLAELDEAAWDALYAVNVRAPVFLTQAALPALRRSPAAAVVNVSSAAAWMYRPGQALYGSTKHAIEYVTRSLAAELAPDRIRVNCIVPGPVETEIHRQWSDDLEAVRASLSAQTALGRMGQPDEVAWWIAQLAEPEAAWMTGSIVHVDGGRTLGPPTPRG
jgi:NAD(P)-dependent dehydrogenase (short-subunit alcohol dehydrogenase family)